jgi:hypothetical protein
MNTIHDDNATTADLANIPHPAGATSVDEWEDSGYRLVWGDARRAESSNFSVQPVAVQLRDGSVPIQGVDSQQPFIHVDELENGVSYEGLTITVDAARGLAAALLAAADEIERWAQR